MFKPEDISGDLAAAATALAGLMLVFMGAVSTGFDAYDAAQQTAVKGKYLRRVWLAFAGFLSSLIAAACGLLGKWYQCDALVGWSLLILLLGGFSTAVVAAVVTARDVK